MLKSVTCVLVPALLAAGFVQGLKSKKWELPASLKKIQEGFDGKKYGACLSELKTVAAEINKLRAAQLFASFPAVPAAWESPDEKPSDSDVAGFAMLGFGGGVKREYHKKDDSNVTITITLMGDSPMVAALAPIMSNPQLLGGDGEVVTFGAHKGVFKANKEDKTGSLQLLVAGSHMINAEWRGIGRDDLDPFLSEDAVKKMAEALQN